MRKYLFFESVNGRGREQKRRKTNKLHVHFLNTSSSSLFIIVYIEEKTIHENKSLYGNFWKGLSVKIK